MTGVPALARISRRLYLRHWGRMLFFSSCLGAGTAFLFGIENLLAAVRRAVASRARELTAADVEAGSSRPFDARARAAFDRLASEGVRQTEVLYFSSMLEPGAREPFLVSVKAIRPEFPFYGRMELEPADAKARLFEGPACLLEESGALQHGIKVGDEVRLGGRALKVAGLIRKEPDRAFGSFSLGPRLVVSLDLAQKSGLAGLGSRLWHERLLALPPSPDPARAAEGLRADLERALDDPYLSISAYSDADPSVREALQRLTIFFVLVSLVALLLGSIGMAASVTLFLNEQLETAGLLRCLGLAPGEVGRIYRGLCLAVGLQGGLIGAAAGWTLGALGLETLVRLLKPQFDIRLIPDPWSLAQALALSAALAVGVTWGKVRALSKVSPLDLMRDRAERLPATPWGTALTAAAGLAGTFAYAYLKVNSVDVARYFSLALVGSAAAIGLLAGLALQGAGTVARRVQGPLALRHGLLQLARQKARSSVFLFTLSAGFALLGALGLVHRSLAREILLGKAADVPDLFLVDIQKDQVDTVAGLAGRFARDGGEFAPLIRARLTHVNGVPIARRDLSGMTIEERSRHRMLTREYNLTYKDVLHASERVTTGRFWSPGETVPQVSLEEGFAQRSHLSMGDVLRFDIQGRAIEGPVTSLRSIDWMSMKPNFFVILPVKVLEPAPQVFIASLRTRDPAATAELSRALVKACPNVSAINVGRVLDNVQAVLGAMVSALRVIAWFCVAVGLLVLAGTLSLGHKERRDQAALFRALGCERKLLLQIDAVEFLALGLVTFVVALGVSYGLGYAVAREMNVTFAADPGSLLLTLAAALLLPAAVGLAVNARAYGAGVLESFRREG